MPSAVVSLDKRRAELLTRLTSQRPDVEQRMGEDKALRARVPHGRHGEYRPSRLRKDPVALLEEQARTRVPLLIPDRYALLTSPFGGSP